jgi:hypothetical protein
MSDHRYRYSTLGANLGGPVPLKPFRDDMFFFYAYEHLRIRDPQPVRRVRMPAALERQGDFSQSFDQAGNPIVVRDPTRASGASRAIPSASACRSSIRRTIRST